MANIALNQYKFSNHLDFAFLVLLTKCLYLCTHNSFAFRNIIKDRTAVNVFHMSSWVSIRANVSQPSIICRGISMLRLFIMFCFNYPIRCVLDYFSSFSHRRSSQTNEMHHFWWKSSCGCTFHPSVCSGVLVYQKLC